MGMNMRTGSTLLGAGVIAAAAFFAGQTTNLGAGTAASASTATLQDGEPQMTPEMIEMFMAMEKAGTPGEHHEVLHGFVGRWEGTYSWRPMAGAPMMKMPAVVERELILGGRFLEEHVVSEMPDGPFQGRGFLGYDNLSGRYTMAWMDSSTTGIYTEFGKYDPKTKTMHMRSEARDPASGHVFMMRSELDLSNPNRHVMKGWQLGDEGEYLAFEGVFERTSGGAHSGHDHDHDH